MRTGSIAAALVVLAPRAALACPICFGASDAPMALGMNWGVLTLLGVTLVVLGSFATFFVRLVRAERVGPADRLRQGYGGPPKRSAKAEAGPYVPAEGVGAGFSRPDRPEDRS